MCGIAGVIHFQGGYIDGLLRYLSVMNHLLRHRGPDDGGVWLHHQQFVGLAHRRLSIIDLSSNASQPMTDHHGNWIVFNGEISN